MTRFEKWWMWAAGFHHGGKRTAEAAFKAAQKATTEAILESIGEMPPWYDREEVVRELKEEKHEEG